MAYLLRTVDPRGDWAGRLAKLLQRFPEVGELDIRSMGVAHGWLDEEIWRQQAHDE